MVVMDNQSTVTLSDNGPAATMGSEILSDVSGKLIAIGHTTTVNGEVMTMQSFPGGALVVMDSHTTITLSADGAEATFGSEKISDVSGTMVFVLKTLTPAHVTWSIKVKPEILVLVSSPRCSCPSLPHSSSGASRLRPGPLMAV